MTTAQKDFSVIREEFPILNQKVNGHPLIYFDNAATTQKPAIVIKNLGAYYLINNSNIHRGAHTLADRATGMFEATRKAVQAFINAPEAEECIFTKGVTEGINLVAQTWGRKFLQEGDEVIITYMEHHSNIVPWQMICEEKGAILKVVPIFENGELDLEAYKNLLSARTKLVSCVWASNALGTINPIKEIIDLAHQNEAVVLIDGAQAGSHIPIDVQAMDMDFLVLSGHKLYGPTGLGVLYGKRALLEAMPPYQGGGEMIREVSFSGTTYNDIPFKFEAGTPNIADVIAFKYALEFVNQIGKETIIEFENSLLNRFVAGIDSLNTKFGSNRIKLIGTAANKVAVQSFTIEGKHHFDIGMMLDAKGIAVRTGHHCTQPLMDFYKIEGTVRASFAFYNTLKEVDVLLEALEKIASR
ncbi:MAG: cysteine desulfurase [Bacteroidia bacterium]|nr:cysteine desulfurase [Bacteroidia bacterium]MCF8425558.1 cysteine desulfurase [Bacteroidia bacterium]MCF8447472.1 cysteine desulfurase [Bacteroidia bacterium]